MAAANILRDFTRDALVAGRSRQEIDDALRDAGWSDREIRDALAEFREVDFTPPVPRPRMHVTARDVFLYALLFTALAFSASALVQLIHGVLDIWLPGLGDSIYAERRATRHIRWAMSMLVVAGPLFIWMTYYTDRQMARDPGLRRSLVRKWLTYIALFVAALIFFGDAVYTIYGFLNGEMTVRFLLKAAAVAGVSGAVFAFYLRDVGGDAE